MHALMNALNHTSILTGLTIFSQRVFIDQTASLSCHAMGSYWRPPQPGRQQYTCIMYYDMKYLKPLKNNVIILISPGHNITFTSYVLQLTPCSSKYLNRIYPFKACYLN